ncbi:MAG: TonB-dependent receptor [Prevotella sp.]|jgi:outer membrane receptor for ferrienterochelin and colicins
MKRLLSTMLTLFCAVALMGQETDAMLFGDVKSKTTGQHLPYVQIQVKGTKLITNCDKSGHFQLSPLPVGEQTIVASLVGYKPQELKVVMERNKGTEVYFLMEEDEQDLDQVVITGTRTQHFLKDVPIRTEVLTSQALKNKNAQNLYEALEGVPGIRVEQQCQFCNFSMVRMQGLGAEHTQVLIDGEPIYSGLAGVYGLSQMGTNDIDRLEIVKGAGSALYGSSAVAGAINIITKSPGYEPSVSGDVQFGNFGYRNYNASASMRKRNIGFSVFAQRTEGDAVDETQDGETRDEVKHKDDMSDRVASQLTNMGFTLHLFHPFAKNDKLVLHGKLMEEHRAGGTLTDDLYLNPFSQGTENITTNRLSADMNYNLPIGKHSELAFSTAYVHHKRNATNDTFLNDYMESHDNASPDVQMMRPYVARENTFTPSLTFTTHLPNHTLLGGVQGYFTRLRETGLYCINDVEDPHHGTAYTSVGKKRAAEFGVFVQDEWTILPGLVAVPGLRFDIHSSSEEYASDEKVFDGTFPKAKFNETTFNPRLALKYEITPALVLRANVGTGFRAPYGFSEDLHLCSGSPRVWKSADLKGERAVSFNLSADYYGNDYQLSANLFRTNLNDKIEFVPADDNVKKLGYTYQWQNQDDAYVQGIELGVKWNPFKDFRTALGWTFNQGRYKHVRDDWADTPYAEASKHISRFPAMTGDLNLEYTPGTWTFTVNGSLQGKMYIDYMKDDEIAEKIKETNTFMLFNARVAKRLGVCSIYAGGKNILGYVQDEKHTDNAAFMYAPVYGATWYAGISMKL